MLPKAELHLHLEGSILPKRARMLAEKNHIDLPESIFGADDVYQWKDFLDFLNKYDTIADLICSAEDFYHVMYDYLEHSANLGVIYSELTVSPDHLSKKNIDYQDLLSSTEQAINDARDKLGIESRIIMTGVRHFGVASVEQVARLITKHPHPYVVGFGLAGDEVNFPARQFARAFEIITEAGLHGTAHAGEVSGAKSIREAIETLPIKRIGHGVRAIEDESLIQTLIDRNITLEICPSSNVALGVFPDLKSHPFLPLYRRGVSVTLNSDDPFFFDTTIGKEYDIAKNIFGLSEKELLGITHTAIKNSFAEETLKNKLLKKL